MTSWKVTRKVGGVHRSCIFAYDEIGLDYPFGKEVHPTVGMIFVFNSFENAYEWASCEGFQSYCILRCDSPDLEPPKCMSSSFYEDDIRHFWEEYPDIEALEDGTVGIPGFSDNVPYGTMYTAWVIPREVVFEKPDEHDVL